MQYRALLVVYIVASCCVCAQPQEIIVDGRAANRTFDGQGALSAGASSRLLADYPPQQREEIMVRMLLHWPNPAVCLDSGPTSCNLLPAALCKQDLLFTPGVGASLSILKVEIGGDTQVNVTMNVVGVSVVVGSRMCAFDNESLGMHYYVNGSLLRLVSIELPRRVPTALNLATCIRGMTRDARTVCVDMKQCCCVERANATHLS